MSSVDDLVTWLRAQLDEDERMAREAADGDSGRWFFGDKWNVYRAEDIGGEDGELHELVVYGNVKPQSEHIALHDPARVLREVESKRLILDALPSDDGYDAGRAKFSDYESCDDSCVGQVMHEVVKLLALPYADRPGYREEWKP